MRRSLRRTFGLLALLALTFSFGESVWGAMCAPTSSAMGPLEGASELVASGAEYPDSDHLCPFMAHPDEQHEQGSTRCPLAPAATQGCAATASLPANGALIPSSLPVAEDDAASAPLRYALLLARPLFHPPRA